MFPMRACTRHLSLFQRGHTRVRGLASATFFSLLLVGLLAGCGSGGGGGTGTQPTSAQAGIVITTITDPSVPIIAMAADQNWKERIMLVGNKDAAGNPINLTQVVYSALGQEITIVVGGDGLPSEISDQAGNKVVFTTWTSSTADVTFFDYAGETIVGPTTIPIDAATIAALKNASLNTSQGKVTAGLQTAVTKNDARIWLPFASDAISATICATGLILALPSGGTSFVIAAGSCLLTAGLIAGINDPGLKTIDSQLSIIDDLGTLPTTLFGATLTAGNLASIIFDNFAVPAIDALPPAKPTWFDPGIVADHNYILLAWRGSESDSHIQGFLVTRDDNKTFATTSGTYRDYTVTPGRHYCYQIQAYKAPNTVFRWSAMSAPLCATVPMIAPPLVITGTATNITPSSVTLNGSVNPNGSITTAYFEYGSSTSYGNRTQVVAAGNGASLINLTGNLSNLVPNTTYHYRVVATNSEGIITRGSNQTFRSVVPVTGAPTISNVFPVTVTGSNSAQPFTINGRNFVTGARVTLRDKRTGEVFPNRQPSSFTTTSITLNPVFTTTPGTWSVNVVNPDNSSTGEHVFSVVAPTGGPLSFASLSPSVVEANAIGYQPALTVSGSNFNNVKQISFDWNGVASGNSTWIRGDINWLRKVTINSDGSMTLKPVVTQTGDPAGITNWTVTLTDTAGMIATRPFTVNYTPTTSLDFISPSLGTINTSTVGYQPTLTANGNVTQVSVSWSGATSGSETWGRNDALWLNRVTSNPDGTLTLRPVVTQTGDAPGITNWTVTIRDNTGATLAQSFSVNYQPTGGGGSTLLPDLVVDTVTATPTSAAPGASVTVAFTVRNQGAGAIGTTTARIRLASGTTIQLTDPLLAEVTVPGLAAGVTNTQSRSLTVPAGTSAGNYFMGVTANAPDGAPPESNNNNQRTTPYTVAAVSTGPDLRVLSGVVSPSSVRKWEFGVRHDY